MGMWFVGQMQWGWALCVIFSGCLSHVQPQPGTCVLCLRSHRQQFTIDSSHLCQLYSRAQHMCTHRWCWCAIRKSLPCNNIIGRSFWPLRQPSSCRILSYFSPILFYYDDDYYYLLVNPLAFRVHIRQCLSMPRMCATVSNQNNNPKQMEHNTHAWMRLSKTEKRMGIRAYKHYMFMELHQSLWCDWNICDLYFYRSVCHLTE